jgi:hypothetical protein
MILFGTQGAPTFTRTHFPYKVIAKLGEFSKSVLSKEVNQIK